MLSYALGDFDGYNPQWGGLPAFRQHIRDLKNADQVALLYYDAVLMDASAKNAKMVPEFAVINHQYKCAPAHDVANPTTPPGIVAKFHQYAMCVNAEKFADYTIDDVVRVVEETGADGVRLDEFGGGGHLCFSTMHSHIFSNEGWGNPVLQAVAYITRGIREKLGRSGREVLLLTEFPGHDMLVSTLDGALCYDGISRRSFARPAQINLLRFYFRNCKLFEIIEDAGDHKPAPWDLWLWNAVGVYNSGEYPDHIRSLLLDNNDAFDLGELEPLVDTVCDGVYANRFTSGRKRIWTLFNAAGPYRRPAAPEAGRQRRRPLRRTDDRPGTCVAGRTAFLPDAPAEHHRHCGISPAHLPEGRKTSGKGDACRSETRHFGRRRPEECGTGSRRPSARTCRNRPDQAH